MKKRQEENKRRHVPAEHWLAEQLRISQEQHGGFKLKWTRQARWGYRIFDFWNAHLGIAIEVDGDTHDPEYDQARDKRNYERSGIIVLRVKNFNQKDLAHAIFEIEMAKPWKQRRKEMGID